jgi:predicted RNA-binding Zn-ribbon protein involved in translation (DUF1610 family)
MDENRLRIFVMDGLNRPTYCKSCQGVMVYKGLGEYRCEDCGEQDYDDYGKVRSYLEAHRGANVTEISEETGVSHKSIRNMIKEDRFAVIDNSGGYIRCEMCGKNINSGRLCSKCEMIYHRQLEAEARSRRKPTVAGGSARAGAESGSMRYARER